MARINYYESTPEEQERHAEATDTGLLSRLKSNKPMSLPDEYPDRPGDTYQEEMEYHYQQNPIDYPDRPDESSYRDEMEYHYRNNPTRRERVESAINRGRGVVNQARGVANQVSGFGAGLFANLNQPRDPHQHEREELEYHYNQNPNRQQPQPGRSRREPPQQQPGPVRSAFARPMMDPLIRQIAGGSGFGGLGAGPSRGRAPPPQPSRTGSIIITTCDDYGNCTTKKIGGQKKPRQPRRRGFVGGLGGDDPGFF